MSRNVDGVSWLPASSLLLELQVQVPAGEAVCFLSLTHLSWVARKQASPAGSGSALLPLPPLLT